VGFTYAVYGVIIILLFALFINCAMDSQRIKELECQVRMVERGGLSSTEAERFCE
jgi:hypothetical protein